MSLCKIPDYCWRSSPQERAWALGWSECSTSLSYPTMCRSFYFFFAVRAFNLFIAVRMQIYNTKYNINITKKRFLKKNPILQVPCSGFKTLLQHMLVHMVHTVWFRPCCNRQLHQPSGQHNSNTASS